MGYFKKTVSKFTITKLAGKDHCILSFESKEKNKIIKDLEKLAKEKEFLYFDSENGWKIFGSCEGKTNRLTDRLQNSLEILDFFDKEIENRFSRIPKYNCRFFLKSDSDTREIAVWFSKQFEFCKGGYFYTIIGRGQKKKGRIE